MTQKVIDNVVTYTTPQAMMQAIDDNFDELYNMVSSTYNTVALLRAETVTPVTGSSVMLLGHTAIGDGGGGVFYWDSTSTATDDSGTIIKLTTVTTGRYMRLIEGVYVTPKMFGAIGNGTTDDTIAMTKAIASAVSKKLVLYITPGTYKITSTLAITNPITILGDQEQSIIAPNFTTGDVITVTGVAGEGGFNIDGVQIKPSVTRTSGHLLNVISCYYTDIRNCLFNSGYNGVGLTGSSGWYFHMRDCIVCNQTNYGITITADSSGQGPVDVSISDVLLHGTSQASQMIAGINIDTCGDIALQHISTMWTGIGLRVSPGAGKIIQALYVTDCFFDTGNSHGIYIYPTSTGVVQLLKVADCWVASNSLSGIYIGGGGGAIQQADIVNTVSSANLVDGIVINTDSTNVNVTGCSCSANSNNGIAVQANANLFRVTNCNLGASGQFAGNTQRGMLVSPGTSNNYIINNNIFRSNGLASLYDGGTGTNKVVSDNLTV